MRKRDQAFHVVVEKGPDRFYSSHSCVVKSNYEQKLALIL